jgi:hypothetical protein
VGLEEVEAAVEEVGHRTRVERLVRPFELSALGGPATPAERREGRLRAALGRDPGPAAGGLLDHREASRSSRTPV